MDFLNLQNDFFLFENNERTKFLKLTSKSWSNRRNFLELPFFGLRLRQNIISVAARQLLRRTSTCTSTPPPPHSSTQKQTNKQTNYTHIKMRQNKQTKTKQKAIKKELNIKNYGEIFLYKHKILKIYKEFNFF